MRVAVITSGVSKQLVDILGIRLEKSVTMPDGNISINEADAADYSGYGTQLISLIAALASDVEIVSIKAISDIGTANQGDFANGIDLSIDAEADIIFIPLGSPQKSEILADAVAHAIKKTSW